MCVDEGCADEDSCTLDRCSHASTGEACEHISMHVFSSIMKQTITGSCPDMELFFDIFYSLSDEPFT